MHIGKFTYKDQANAFGYPKTTSSAQFTPPIQLSNYQQIKTQYKNWRYHLAYLIAMCVTPFCVYKNAFYK